MLCKKRNSHPHRAPQLRNLKKIIPHWKKQNNIFFFSSTPAANSRGDNIKNTMISSWRCLEDPQPARESESGQKTGVPESGEPRYRRRLCAAAVRWLETQQLYILQVHLSFTQLKPLLGGLNCPAATSFAVWFSSAARQRFLSRYRASENSG